MNAQFQTSKLSQSPEPSYGRIARIGFLAQVIQHLVTVIGPHGNGGVTSSLSSSSFLFPEDFPDDSNHVDITFQVVGLKKVPMIIPGRASQMQKVDTIREPSKDAEQIIVFSHPK